MSNKTLQGRRTPLPFRNGLEAEISFVLGAIKVIRPSRPDYLYRSRRRPDSNVEASIKIQCPQRN